MTTGTDKGKMVFSLTLRDAEGKEIKKKKRRDGEDSNIYVTPQDDSQMRLLAQDMIRNMAGSQNMSTRQAAMEMSIRHEFEPLIKEARIRTKPSGTIEGLQLDGGTVSYERVSTNPPVWEMWIDKPNGEKDYFDHVVNPATGAKENYQFTSEEQMMKGLYSHKYL